MAENCPATSPETRCGHRHHAHVPQLSGLLVTSEHSSAPPRPAGAPPPGWPVCPSRSACAPRLGRRAPHRAASCQPGRTGQGVRGWPQLCGNECTMSAMPAHSALGRGATIQPRLQSGPPRPPGLVKCPAQGAVRAGLRLSAAHWSASWQPPSTPGLKGSPVHPGLPLLPGSRLPP